MSEFLAMGGYANFVWPSYAITTLAFVASIWQARRAHRNAVEAARRRLAMEPQSAEESHS
jgi:heme exporter protein CcmD